MKQSPSEEGEEKTDSEKLSLLADWFEKYDLTLGRIGQDECQKDLRRIATRLQELEKSENQWISAKERLPLATDKIDAQQYIILPHRTIARYTKLYGGWVHSGYGSSNRHELGSVTHWMPLPSPPKNQNS